jgi:predicted metal-binding protein
LISNNAEDLDELFETARKLGAIEVRLIKSEEIVVRDWVRLKCMFGCDGFGKRLTCPPYSPTPEELRKVLKEYQWAVLFKFEKDVVKEASDLVRHQRELHHFVVQMEKEAFLKGYYSAFGFGAGACPNCESECSLSGCIHPDLARPSMEGCGVDVFATVSRAGFAPRVAKKRNEKPTFYALLLLA